jgi:rhodanese-related sulfurtransferase
MPREIERGELVAKLPDPNVRLLDVQAPGWFEREHLPGAIRGRIDDADGTLAQLGDDLDAEIIVYCYNATCAGSELAAKLLEGRGYRNVRRYTAGKQDWIDAGLPLEARTEHS